MAKPATIPANTPAGALTFACKVAHAAINKVDRSFGRFAQGTA
jgi:hypothetical protein